MGAELEYYKIHSEHAKHLELQRSTIAGIAAALAGAMIGELLKSPLTSDKLPFAVTLLFVGLFALLFSAKLFERIKLHNEIAKLARDRLDPTLDQLRKQAEATHKKKYPLMYPLGLHIVWNCFFAMLIALGLVLTIKIMMWPAT